MSNHEFDYVAIGHVTRDLAGDTFSTGGTVSYASRTASAMGCRVGVLTSAGPEFDPGQEMKGVSVVCFPAAATTTFENAYTPGGRRQVLHAVARTLRQDMVPPGWRTAVVHLGPVAQECDPALIDAFDGAFVGLTPQGWMRRWDGQGTVGYARWASAERLLPRADAVVMSEEDVPGDEDLASQYASLARLLVVTRGGAGCTVYVAGQPRTFPALSVRELDPTGSGDVFAAALFVRLQRGSDPWAAARFANCVAARSVTRRGLAGTPGPAEIARCERALAR